MVYNSIDFIMWSEPVLDLRGKLGRKEEKNIVTTGRLVPWKGLDGLIEAVAELKKLFSIKLIVVGDGPDRDRLAGLARKKEAGDAVIFLGRAPLEEVFNYYNLADVFVLNSKYEGLSHILLEVLSLGKPIVASNCGGNPEVIANEKNGLLVEYNNVGQLAAAIKRMLTEEKWRSDDYKNICCESLKKFNWADNVNKTMKLFNNVLNEQGTPHQSRI